MTNPGAKNQQSVPITPRSIARHLVLDGLSALNRREATANLSRPRIHFLFCHALMPKDVPKFDKFIRSLTETHEFVGHTEAAEKILLGDITKPTISFSFDDGLQSNLVAANILERYGARGMFFVPTNFIDTKTISEAHRFFGHTVEINEPAMTWNDLETLIGRGHEVGNHTANHRTLSEIGLEEAAEEIFLGAQTLRERLGTARHFAWPRGAFSYFPDELRKAVFDSGHETCSSGVRGAHVSPAPDNELLCIRRDLVASYWPTRHSLYFASTSAKKAEAADNYWPKDSRTN